MRLASDIHSSSLCTGSTACWHVVSYNRYQKLDFQKEDTKRTALLDEIAGIAGFKEEFVKNIVTGVYEVQIVKYLVELRCWPLLCGYLQETLGMGGVGNKFEDTHSSLLLPLYREAAGDLMQKQETEAEAFRLYTGKISKLVRVTSEYSVASNANSYDQEIFNIVKKICPFKPERAKDITRRICDYFRLYFPEIASFETRSEEHVYWQFTFVVKKPKGHLKSTLRCMACDHVFNNCSISKIKQHLGHVAKRVYKCPMISENLRRRIKIAEETAPFCGSQIGEVRKQHAEKTVPKMPQSYLDKALQLENERESDEEGTELRNAAEPPLQLENEGESYEEASELRNVLADPHGEKEEIPAKKNVLAEPSTARKDVEIPKNGGRISGTAVTDSSVQHGPKDLEQEQLQHDARNLLSTVSSFFDMFSAREFTAQVQDHLFMAEHLLKTHREARTVGKMGLQ